MSLLLGARGKDFIVLLADGYSLHVTEEKSGEEKKVKTTVTRRDLPKLFSLGKLPCVVAHHGQNKLGGLRVERVLTGATFQRMQTQAWSQGLNVAMAKTVEQLDSVVSQTLKSSRQRNMFGLWFAGFWPCTDIPEITELAWVQRSANGVRVAMQPFANLVLGGSGARHLREYLKGPVDDEFDAAKLAKSPPEYAMEMLKRMYGIGLERQKKAGRNEFGGQRQMALITRDGVDLGPLN